MLPASLNPMLAQSAEGPFYSDQHLFEVKWDGMRCLAYIERRQVRLQSRRLSDMTFQFPELTCLGQLPSGTLLDGELVIWQGGRPSLGCIQRRALLQSRQRIECAIKSMPVTYMVFDLLYLKGKSLITWPLGRRRQALQELIEQYSLPSVVLIEAVRWDGHRLFGQVVRLGLEGLVAKHVDSPYLAGRRSGYWLKIKPKTVGDIVSPDQPIPVEHNC